MSWWKYEGKTGCGTVRGQYNSIPGLIGQWKWSCCVHHHKWTNGQKNSGTSITLFIRFTGYKSISISFHLLQNIIIHAFFLCSKRVLLSTSDATKTYFNIDYAPLNNLRDAIAKANGNTPENLPKPVATRFANVEQSYLQNSTIKEILETSLPNGTTVSTLLQMNTTVFTLPTTVAHQ